MYDLHNDLIVQCIVEQLNKAIKKWMAKKKAENRAFKFNFGTEAGWCIARMGIPLDVIDYIVKTRLDKYDITDYTYEIENDERILTLYFP